MASGQLLLREDLAESLRKNTDLQGMDQLPVAPHRYFDCEYRKMQHAANKEIGDHRLASVDGVLHLLRDGISG